MKKLCSFALVVTFAAAVPALASTSTLCASGAGSGFGYSGTSTPGVPVAPASPLYNASCTAGALTIATTDDDNALAKWHTSAPGYPAGLTLGQLEGLNAPVITNGTGGSEPYYDIAFYATNNSLGAGTSGDLITLLENETTTVSAGNLGMSANSTLFDVYDYTQSNLTGTNVYLLGGQSDTNTLSYLTSNYTSLSTDAIYALDIGIGSATCSGAPCTGSPVSMTVNYLDVTVPEGGSESLYLLVAGMACLAALVLGRRWGSTSSLAN
jgi:hypothetical protein